MAVTGIGGIFFRSRDPEALSLWYRAHLGVVLAGYTPWQQAAGPTLIMPFAADTNSWPADIQWMMNFRVTDINTLLVQLRTAGVTVTTDPAWDSAEIGRFARIHDPEGNPIELWEPPVED